MAKSKVKTLWFCAECGHKQARWSGQCPQCQEWNCLNEEMDVSTMEGRFEVTRQVESSEPVRIRDVNLDKTPRFSTKIIEFDRLVGGGVVPGSLTLVGGCPGIGKSTLLMQVANALASQGLRVLYVCGEESVAQTTLRARRLGIESDNLLLLSETNFSFIKAQIDKVQPHLVIVDSIQIIYKSELSSAPGSVSQVRECATEFMHLSKGSGVAVMLVGHVTKSGEIAGPRVLEHLVDTVLYFEGDRQQQYRMMRVIKNRFGGTDEIAVFQMNEKGLSEISNPSQIFLEERMKATTGTVVIPTLEGSRPILVELQSLVTDTVFPTPSRRCAGLDQNRLALLLAVLEKRVGYQIYRCDVFVSVAGGIKIIEPAIDLGILLAVASSYSNKVINPQTTVMGEVGLTGEVRSVSKIETRIKEAIHMGFKQCVIPKHNMKGLPASLSNQIQISSVEFVEEAIHALIQ